MLNVTPLDLNSRLGNDVLNCVAKLASPELITVAARLTRLFAVPSPFAPGFFCIGGLVTLDDEMAASCRMSSLSVTGNGETLAAALVSCLGEAAELLSQFEMPGDVEPSDLDRNPPGFVADGWIGEAISAAGAIDWIAAHSVVDDVEAALPADICLRRLPARRAVEPVGALSAGVAAGPSFAAAANRAILELCERDAAALWWLGGSRPTGFALEHPAASAATGLIERLRQGVTSRRTRLLNITTDIGVPAVAAISVDHDGRGMACGLAARQSWHEAAQSAVLEMCQMELAAPVARAKLDEGGEARLNEADRRHLRRAEFNATDCELLHPHELSQLKEVDLSPQRDDLPGHLESHGIRLFLVDLTRPNVSVPVVRAVSPELQPFSLDVATRRFVRMRTENADAAAKVAGIPLLS